jgi:hypothetical protein
MFTQYWVISETFWSLFRIISGQRTNRGQSGTLVDGVVGFLAVIVAVVVGDAAVAAVAVSGVPGGNFMILIFGDFQQFSAKTIGVFLVKQCNDSFLS